MLLWQSSTVWEGISCFQSSPVRIWEQLLTALSLLLVNILSFHPWVEIPHIQRVNQGQINTSPPKLWVSYSWGFFPTSQNSSLIGSYIIFRGTRFSKQGSQCIHAIHLTNSPVTLWDAFHSSSLFQREQALQHPCHTLTSPLTSDTNQATTTI